MGLEDYHKEDWGESVREEGAEVERGGGRGRGGRGAEEGGTEVERGGGRGREGGGGRGRQRKGGQK